MPQPSDCSPDFKQSSLELNWSYASKQDFATQINQLEVPRNQGFCSKNMVPIHVSWMILVSWTNGDHWPKHQMTWERLINCNLVGRVKSELIVESHSETGSVSVSVLVFSSFSIWTNHPPETPVIPLQSPPGPLFSLYVHYVKHISHPVSSQQGRRETKEDPLVCRFKKLNCCSSTGYLWLQRTHIRTVIYPTGSWLAQFTESQFSFSLCPLFYFSSIFHSGMREQSLAVRSN